MNTPAPALAAEPETDPQTPRTRRSRSRRPRGGRICERPGCKLPREVGLQGVRYEFCSYVCRIIDAELTKTKRVCEAAGPSPATGELWSSVVELADTLSRYLAADRELQEAARSVGFTDSAWQAIRDGTS